jgi:hypothetical protein
LRDFRERHPEIVETWNPFAEDLKTIGAFRGATLENATVAASGNRAFRRRRK